MKKGYLKAGQLFNDDEKIATRFENPQAIGHFVSLFSDKFKNFRNASGLFIHKISFLNFLNFIELYKNKQ